MLAANTWGYAFFGFGTWPSWAVPKVENVTECIPVGSAAAAGINSTLLF